LCKLKLCRMFTAFELTNTRRNAFLIGFPYMVAVIGLPQRLQVVSGKSPSSAGLAAMPLLLSSAVGSALGAAAMVKKNLTFHALLASNAFQALGIGLLASVSLSGGARVPARFYGFEVLFGFGVGLNFVTLMIIGRLESKYEEQGMRTRTRSSFCNTLAIVFKKLSHFKPKQLQ
jgi:hypothetical protein